MKISNFVIISNQIDVYTNALVPVSRAVSPLHKPHKVERSADEIGILQWTSSPQRSLSRAIHTSFSHRARRFFFLIARAIQLNAPREPSRKGSRISIAAIFSIVNYPFSGRAISMDYPVGTGILIRNRLAANGTRAHIGPAWCIRTERSAPLCMRWYYTVLIERIYVASLLRYRGCGVLGASRFARRFFFSYGVRASNARDFLMDCV